VCGARASRDPGAFNAFSLLEALKEDRRGLVVLSPSLSFLDRLARATGTQDLYIALYPFGPQRERIRFSRETGIPLAAVTPVYFLDRPDHRLHRLLRAIALCTKLDRVPAGELAPAWAFFQSPEQWIERYLHCPEALEGMRKVAEKCRMTRPPWGGWVFPGFEGLSEDRASALLEEKARRGAVRRYGAWSRAIEERLAHELGIIRAKGFASYFLVVEDIVSRFPITCGRGSAAASLVSYCLGITHVDPLRHNLFFERFLNMGRGEPPDIDVDFPWDERDAVLSYVLDKYGPERCAMVANHVGFRMRGAIREVAKVYGIPEEEIQRVSDDVSHLRDLLRNPRAGTPSAGAHGSRAGRLAEPWPAILRWAERLAGTPRHLSVHCGGVVITPDALPERVPVEQAPKGVPIIQWEKDITEAAGLVKIDLLGNRSLAVVRDTLASIQANYGIHISYPQLNPLEDAKTRQMLARGDTVGVFYVESPAMRQLLKKTGKGDFEHLVVQSSIIRPAANELIREYVRRDRGGAYEPLHPALAEILEETRGILCYQEDVSRVAMALAGFDAVQADELRKVLAKKHKQARLPDYRERFFRGALARGVAREVIEEVWRMILSFQGYSFCKPHSASYALVSFKACYLRAHFPAEFMAAVLSNRGGYYTTLAYLSEARRMGLTILPPDVNASALPYAGYGRNLRVGLMQLKGVGEASLAALLEDRARRGPFGSLEEILARVDMDPSDLRVLIKAGCLDAIAQGRSRPELLWGLLAWEARREGKGERAKGKGEKTCHFRPPLRIAGAGSGGNPGWVGKGDLPLPFSGAFQAPKTMPYRPELLLRHELETLGLLVSRHPLEIYAPWLSRVKAVPASDLAEHVGKKVTTVGWFVTGKTVLTRREEPMEFVSFEDTTALYETTFFPRAYERFSRMLGYHRPYLLRGRVEEDFGAVSLVVEDIGRQGAI
jgi:error-prone DNA polymerase